MERNKVTITFAFLFLLTLLLIGGGKSFSKLGTRLAELGGLAQSSTQGKNSANSLKQPPDDFTVRQLTERASVIFVGRAVDLSSKWDAKHRLIFTYATYSVDTPVKGAAFLQNIVVKSIGGTVGRISQAFVGGPQFKSGSRDLLFLSPSDEGGILQLVDILHGKIHVVTDPKTGQEVILSGTSFELTKPNGDSINLEKPKETIPGKANIAPRQPFKIPRQSLKEVLQKVQEYMEIKK